MEAIFCTQCGCQLNPSDLFCSRCGTKKTTVTERSPYDDSPIFQAPNNEGKLPDAPFSPDPPEFSYDNNNHHDNIDNESMEAQYASTQFNLPDLPSKEERIVTDDVEHVPEPPKLNALDTNDRTFTNIFKDDSKAYGVMFDQTKKDQNMKVEKKSSLLCGLIDYLKKFHIPNWSFTWFVWIILVIIYLCLLGGHIFAFVYVNCIMVFTPEFKIFSSDETPALFSFGLFPSGIFCVGVVCRCWFSLGAVGIGLICLGMASGGMLVSIGQVSLSQGFCIGQLATGFYIPFSQVSLSVFNKFAQLGFAIGRPFFEKKGDESVMNSCDKKTAI